MLYAYLLLYIAAIYVRPAEVVPALIEIPVIDILSGGAAFLILFSLIASPRRIWNMPQDKLVLALWLIIGVSNVREWVWMAWDSWLNFAPVVFCYFLVRAAIRTERHLRGLVYALVILNLFLAINGIVQYHTGIGLGDVTTQLDRIRGTGIFNDPNDMGLTFVMAFPMFIAASRNKEGTFAGRIFFALMQLVVLTAIYYTNSRGTLLGLGVALGVYAFYRSGKVIALLLVLASAGLVVMAGPSRSEMMGYEEESAQSRIQSWAAGWVMLKSSPVVGVGYGRFTDFNPLVAHNSFVHTFAELGLSGVFCLVGLFYWFFKGIWRARVHPTEPHTSLWRSALLASGAGVVVCVWFLSRQYVVVLYVFFALSACAMAIRAEADNQTHVPMSGRDLRNITGLTALAVMAAYVSIRTMAIWSGV